MQTTFLLLDDIRNALKAEFADKLYRVPIDGGGRQDEEEIRRAPQVYIGHMPPKQNLVYGADQPFILVRAINGDVTGENPRAQSIRVAIICGIYEPGEASSDAGHLTILTMIDNVIRMLCERFLWADNHWRFELPLEWQHGMDIAHNSYELGLQGHPFYNGKVMARFVARATVTAPTAITTGLGVI